MTTELSSRLLQQIEHAAEIVKEGGIVAFPTDTVYGLGANPFAKDAVDRIYAIKQRPRYMPLPVLLADESQINEIAASVPGTARLFMKRFWPGGLTIVLTKADAFPGSGIAGEKTVAVRMPNHEVALSLIRKAGVPIIVTSANLGGKPSALTASQVAEQLGNDVDIIVDGGRCLGGVESTVVDLTAQAPLILRPGAVAEEAITQAYQEYKARWITVRIALGNDHRGVAVKQAIIELLKRLGHDYHDFGTNGTESVDYPDFARLVAKAVSAGEFDYGILVCSTGIGMCIAANKVNRIRAALCHSVHDAIRSRQHNDANVLCLAGESIELNVNLEIVTAFLSTSFEGGRHLRRLEKVQALEEE